MAQSRTDRSGEIRAHFDQWQRTPTPEGDGTDGVLGPGLHESGHRFHDMSAKEFRAACVALADLALRGRTTTNHHLLWMWAAQLYAGPTSAPIPPEAEERRRLFRLCARLLTVDSSSAMPSWLDAHTAASYLAFPLLEGLVRAASSDYLAQDGTIRQSFSVTNSKGNDSSQTGRCSNVGHALQVFCGIAKKATSKKSQHTPPRPGAAELQSIDGMCQTVAAQRGLPRGSGPFETLFRWRNSTLHGQALEHAGLAAWHAAILVATSYEDAEFEDRAAHQRENLRCSPARSSEHWIYPAHLITSGT